MKNGIRGKARVNGRTKSLVRRLSSCGVASIGHADLDELAAERLIGRRQRAIVNRSASIPEDIPIPDPYP